MPQDAIRADESTPSARVLIVGAGPAGLFAASELMRHGVKPTIVERRLAPHKETRGTVIQPAVLEILDRGGVVEAFLDGAVHIKQIELLGPDLKQIALTELAGLGCKYEFQCSQPQWRTEAILRESLARGGVEVEFGAEVTSIEPERDGLRVTMNMRGASEVVRTAYLLGAGGGHSVTRHSMDERLDGETYGGRYIVADVKIGLPCPPGRGRVIVGRTGFVLLSPLPDNRWLIFVNRDEADERQEPPKTGDLGALLNARAGADLGMTDLRWASYFTMNRRSVSFFSDGRRFLLGDAAHLSSPLGGEGINSALMDAADIAWKLALVLLGAARRTLLDTYAIERSLADRHVLEVSNDIHSLVMQLVAMSQVGPPAVGQEDPAKALAGLRRRSMLDVSYAGSPLISEAGAGGGKPSPGERFPASVRLTGASHIW